jgi:uncharacterized protein YcbK (DUF882 family)
MIIKKGSGLQLTPNFSTFEFDCPCPDCKVTTITDELPGKLQAMRDILGCQLRVTSGYRCANYQEQLRLRGFETAKGISQHELGNAADLSNGVTPGVELEDAARQAGFVSVGVGKQWVHVDLRPGYRRWTYKT